MGIEHQLKRYIVYTCKKCGWQTAILAQWADLKPKKCQNRKCNCLFLREPDQLDVKMPAEDKKASPAKRKKTKTTRRKQTRKKSDERRQKDSKGRNQETRESSNS